MKWVNLVGTLVVLLLVGAGMQALHRGRQLREGRAGRTISDKLARAMGSYVYRQPGRWVHRQLEVQIKRRS